MNIKKEYERWLANATADADVAAELKTLDDAKIEDAFYRDLAFGTGGLRGVIGAGDFCYADLTDGDALVEHYVIDSRKGRDMRLVLRPGEGESASGQLRGIAETVAEEVPKWRVVGGRVEIAHKNIPCGGFGAHHAQLVQ